MQFKEPPKKRRRLDTANMKHKNTDNKEMEELNRVQLDEEELKVNADMENAFRKSHGDHPSYYLPEHIKQITYPDFYKPLFSRDHLNYSDPTTWTLELTQNEQDAFSQLLMAAKTKSVVVRAAGGWVRDKLLRSQSDDIDIAVDTVTGEEFGEMLNQYLKEVKHQTLSIGKIKDNPDKSKHLASITFKLGDITFDVTNLRTEEYTKHSRVPTIKVGTPEQDAYRRDLTYNALFYNINKGCIEDFTNSGIKDLCEGIARTPLAPKETYHDDPLRVFRNIRHTITKLGFKLSAEMIEAMQDPEIHKILRTKVSRERYSTEVGKMLKGHYVSVALDAIVELGLADILFVLPKDSLKPVNFDFASALGTGVKICMEMEKLIFNEINFNAVTRSLNEKEEAKFNLSELSKIKHELLFATFLYPFRDVKYYNAKKREEEIAKYFCLTSMSGFGKLLAARLVNWHCIMELFLKSLDSEQKERSCLVGTALCIAKEEWQYGIMLAKAVLLQKKRKYSTLGRVRGMDNQKIIIT